MTRKKLTYHEDDTERTCNDECGLTLALTAENFQRQSNGPFGWHRKCKPCANRRKSDGYHKRLNSMTQEEYEAFRAKERASTNASRKRVQAKLTPEERKERNRMRKLRERIPEYLVEIKHLRFVQSLNRIGQTWKEFYTTVSEALKATYGYDSMPPEKWNMDGLTDEYREWSLKGDEMRKSETYQLLQSVNDTIWAWEGGGEIRAKFRRMEQAIADLTPEEWAWVQDYKPRHKTSREMLSLSPALEREFEVWLDKKIADGRFQARPEVAEKLLANRDKRFLDPEDDITEEENECMVPENETTLERKHRQRAGENGWLSWYLTRCHHDDDFMVDQKKRMSQTQEVSQ